ncbi:MAG: dihydropteroate synthase [Elusimicrobia bacterium]|nr:dihydropteroate synthase [Elusimicrobiota bacterium]
MTNEDLTPLPVPKVMGILNVTPDSFYDGGIHYEPSSAWHRFEELAAEGADIVDIGAESSRPGSARISEEEELRRLRPLLEQIQKRTSNPEPRTPIFPMVSIDTMKSRVAAEAVKAGAVIINDISALRHDPDGMLGILAGHPKVSVVIMHMRGKPETMQADPKYEDVLGEIAAFFEERLRFLEAGGVSGERVILDPGIGFGKKLEHNLEILKRLGEFKKRFHQPVMIGPSRKSFIGMILDGAAPHDRLEGSLAVALWCAEKGADYLRVHDVAATKKALKVWSAMKGNGVRSSFVEGRGQVFICHLLAGT